MTALVWDKTGERLYETGVDHVALFVMDENGTAYGHGVAWNGVTAITESPYMATTVPSLTRRPNCSPIASVSFSLFVIYSIRYASHRFLYA